MKNKGYVLLIVLILSVIIALIGAGLAFMSKQGFLSTRANTLFNKLQKASHYGIYEAIRRIVVSQGVCEEGIISEELEIDGAKVKISTSRKGFNLCALRTEAKLGGARQVIVATVQGFYGIGTYTTKGSVSANIEGGLISGCDFANNCTIPGFITQGTITTSAKTGTCENPGNRGIFGTPPTKPKVPFIDLTSLTFNADCFACLLGIFEKEDNYQGYPMGLGSNPLWKDEKGTARKDVSFDGSIEDCRNCPKLFEFDEAASIIGYMRINFPTFDEIPDHNYCIEEKGPNIDLSNVNKRCILSTSDEPSLIIRGIPPKNLGSIFIYRNINKDIILHLQNTKNFNFINLKGKITLENVSNSENFAIYNNSQITINYLITGARIVAKDRININTPSTISNSTLITEDRVNANNHLNLRDVIIFAKRLTFEAYKKVNIQGGMLYLYTLADKERTTDRVLYKGCNWGGNPAECAWYGNYLSSFTMGTSDNPVLIILVNSATYNEYTEKININGVLFGEGVTYLTFRNVDKQDYQGILVRNFPNNETLLIRIKEGFSLNFNYGIINTLNQKLWFVRRFECIKDDPLPYAQAIQTYHSSY